MRENFALSLGASIEGFFYGRKPGDQIGIVASARAIAALGLGVEMWRTRGVGDEQLTLELLPELRAACGDAPFVSMHVSPGLWRWDPASLRAEIELAGKVGAETLIVHRETLGLIDPNSRPDIPEIRKLCAQARAFGVRLALENSPDSMWALDYVLDALGDEPEKTNLGICIDVGHAHISHDAGPQPIRGYLERYHRSLIHLHLHDNRGTGDDHLPPGEGSIDWGMALKLVDRVGYQGPGVLEIHSAGDLIRTIGAARDYLFQITDAA